MRTFTPARTNADGSTTVTTHRSCNGCRRDIGDITAAEIADLIVGRPPADVRGECPWCSPGNDQAEFEADMAYLRGLAAAMAEHGLPRDAGRFLFGPTVEDDVITTQPCAGFALITAEVVA